VGFSLYIINFLRKDQRSSMGEAEGAQRPVFHAKELKKTGARIARAVKTH